MKLRNLLIAAASLAVATGVAGAASAHYTGWQRHHTERVQVNQRVNNLTRTLIRDRRSGRISAAQERVLHNRLVAVNRQETRFARHHGGHIGPAEQARLNREENGIREHTPG